MKRTFQESLFSERVDKKGETLSSVLEGLKTYFKDEPAFVQDLENIRAIIQQKQELSGKRRLAMIVTDQPQMLINAGKYPLGCGSCQNYDGTASWNRSLAGYMADAHTKVVFLIDLGKLPSDIRAEIEAHGFKQVKERIPARDWLKASIARAVVKQVRLADGDEPALFVEPTYSSINKGDLSMDHYFNVFLDLLVCEPMGVRLMRGAGAKTVKVPASRNPEGQYEDCAAGNAGNEGMGIQTGDYTMGAHFVTELTPATDADRSLVAHISS